MTHFVADWLKASTQIRFSMGMDIFEPALTDKIRMVFLRRLLKEPENENGVLEGK